MRYENYHKHSHYSNIRTLDSICKPEEYMKRAVELGQKNYFTTEHGFQGNIFEAYTLCQKYGLKCIYAVEAYYVDDISDKTDRTNYHIMLVAMTESGRKQINKIMSVANQQGYYYKPRIDLKLLLSLNPYDVIVTTACVASRMFKGDDWYNKFFIPVFNHFKSNFYLEVQNHNSQVQIEYNKKILAVKNKLGIKIIHANDSHYIYPEDSKYRDLFLKAKGISYEDESNFILDYPDTDTIIERYKKQGVLNDDEIKETLESTLIFDNAEGIHLDKEFKIPNINKEVLKQEIPYINVDNDDNKILKDIIKYEWNIEKIKIPASRLKEYQEAIYYEMDIIQKCGMARYFILDYIIVKKAVNEYNAVLTRSGRGSAVSFYINHLLGLTEIDRLKAPVTLYPTRFMSAERILNSKSLPDIDLNFSDIKPVVKSSKDILGENGIYYMVAYKPLQKSSAFRLWCKANGYNINEYDEIAKNLDDYIDDKKWVKVIEESKIFRGVIESIAPSPCSFLLLDKPITDEIGLIRVGNANNYEICCCLDGYNCDVYKYLKNDFLTVKCYEIIDKVYQLIGRPIDDISTLINNCDNKVWNIYANGLTTTINQSDSDFGKQTLKRYKPNSLAEMSAWVAAIRPGFASLLNNFLDRKPYSTGIIELDNILKDSFHYMMYQESIMKYLVWLGIEEKETYDIIKKIAKKKFTNIELDELKKQLQKNWIKNVDNEKGFNETWQVVQDASHYSFNACVSGDTIIQKQGISNSRYNPTIEEMYLIKNDYSYAKKNGHIALYNKYRKYGYGNALSMFDDGRIRKNKIVDIRLNGIKEIYRIKTKSGAYLDCTMNHKFPTPNGKTELKNLSIGDLLYVKGEYEKHPDNYRFTNGTFESNIPKLGQKGFQNIPNGNSVKFHKVNKYKKENQCCCEICNKQYDNSKFELHHKDMDRTNNEENNLIWLCNSCHKKEHYKLGRKKAFEKGIPVFEDEIISIEYLRTDNTYDIEMEHPAHTYVSESGLITSNSHSLSVAIDSLYGAYLKSHYPLEYFTVVLSLYSDDKPRTANLINELAYFNIKLKPIKFGKSKADYSMDKETNSIYKGIASIKYCNAAIADELLNLSQNKYVSFIDLLSDIKNKTSVNSRQLEMLTKLNFFSDSGKNKYLLEIIRIYDEFNSIKIISKKKLSYYEEEFKLSEYVVSKYSAKETDSQYRDLNNIGLMNELINKLENTSLFVQEQVKFEIENLEYTTYTNDKIPDDCYIVIEFKTYKDKSKPYIILRNIHTGEEIKTRIKYSKIYKEQPFQLFSVLKIKGFTIDFKSKFSYGKWISSDEQEIILEKYEVLKK